ncbi:beta-1,4 N-acetylgalactosaminyltransferase 1-like [Saccoglossus kowalevskii]|uniref:Beta-1,4 N-acetylgalactosaminyltransferase 1-like n=1 Tax=Saccoglossus kowalevskii TaxID=10224 RepID=A0ABM0LWF7_SACKO|nr:PREDICTED: beta-1,4 N-acetylgalactosaminyltransferase 1-like [Saccoglossus kowalevskii]
MILLSSYGQSAIPNRQLEETNNYDEQSKQHVLDNVLGSIRNYAGRHKHRQPEVGVFDTTTHVANHTTVCPAMSPINYIGHGITMEPLQSVPIIGLSITEDVQRFVLKYEQLRLRIKSLNSFGHLFISMSKEEVRHTRVIIAGNSTGNIIVDVPGSNISQLLSLISTISYTNFIYDTNEQDVLEVNFLHYYIYINLHIRRPSLPNLFNTGGHNDLSRSVSVMTTTLGRYGSVNRMIDSVHFFYPNLAIIVADGSKSIEKINKLRTKQFTKPSYGGFFAGRNLALSQVRTKYVLHVTDDMYFTHATKLEVLLVEMENSTYDIVGAGVWENNNNTDCTNHISVHKSVEQLSGSCRMTESIPIFFLAKTAVLREIMIFKRAMSDEELFENVLPGMNLFCENVWIYREKL